MISSVDAAIGENKRHPLLKKPVEHCSGGTVLTTWQDMWNKKRNVLSRVHPRRRMNNAITQPSASVL